MTRSDNVYFANNEQTLLAVFTASFCFPHAEHNLIKLKLYNNWSAQVLNNISESARKPIKICSPLKISQSDNVE